MKRQGGTVGRGIAPGFFGQHRVCTRQEAEKQAAESQQGEGVLDGQLSHSPVGSINEEAHLSEMWRSASIIGTS